VKLWPHQERGIEALRVSLRTHRSVLGVAPTGAGKTVLGGWMARQSMAKGYRVLWIAHTKELVAQPFEQFKLLGLAPGIIQSGITPSPDALVQVATIQTLVRREMPPADLVVFDEAHLHVGTASSQRVIDAYPKAWFIGLSASPWRLDGRSFAPQYTDLVTIASPEELIQQGILVQPTYYAPSEPDLTGVATVGGDYEKSGLEVACDKPQIVGSVVDSFLGLAKGQAILYAVSRKHSRDCAEALCKAGVNAVHLDGETPDRERDRIIAEFKAGRIDVICNVEVLTTGFDHPGLSCVIIARPTKSVALWMQMVGRAMRRHPGKTHALVLDHAGNTMRLGFAHVSRAWTLEREKKRQGQTSMALTTCKQCFACFLSGTSACPECGYIRPVADLRVIAREGQLVEVTKAFTPEQKLSEFLSLCEQAIRLRLSRDFVKRKFYEKFDHWPRGVKWPPALPVNIALEREKLERVAQAKGLGSWWVEKKLKEMVGR